VVVPAGVSRAADSAALFVVPASEATNRNLTRTTQSRSLGECTVVD
jgi:hypothetical protein